MGVTLDFDPLPRLYQNHCSFPKLKLMLLMLKSQIFWTRELLKKPITPSQNLSRMSLTISVRQAQRIMTFQYNRPLERHS